MENFNIETLISLSPKQLYEERTSIANGIVQMLHNYATEKSKNNAFIQNAKGIPFMIFDKDIYGDDLKMLVEDAIIFLKDFREGVFLSSQNLLKILKKIDVIETFESIRELCSDKAKLSLNQWERLKSEASRQFWRRAYMGHQIAVYFILSELTCDYRKFDDIFDELKKAEYAKDIV